MTSEFIKLFFWDAPRAIGVLLVAAFLISVTLVTDFLTRYDYEANRYGHVVQK